MNVWRRLASRSLAIFLARLTGAGLVLVTQAAMARLWSAELFAGYLIVVAAVNLLAAAMPLGYQVIGGYFAAEYNAGGAGPALRAFARKAYGHVAGMALLLVAIGAAWAEFASVSVLFRNLWMPTLLMAAATAVVFVNGALLVGLRCPVAGFAADTLVRPALMLAGFLFALNLGGTASPLRPMFWFAAAGYAAAALVQFAAVARRIARVSTAAPSAPGESRRWWRLALPWMVISLATDFFFEIDLMLLAPMMRSDELAVFGVCARIFSLCAFGVGAVYAVTLPDIMEAGAARDAREFRRRIGDANVVAAVLAGLLAVAMLAVGPVLGLVFGPAFAAGALPLAILCLALAVRAALGPAALVLSFHDRPHASLPAVGLGLVGLAAGNAVLVPAFGLTGAALAALLSVALWSATAWFVARRDLKLDVSIVPRLKDLLAPSAG